MTISDRKRLNIKTEAPEGVDAREFRMAENIYVLYALSREDRKQYIADLQKKGVDVTTCNAIATILFHLDPIQEVSSEPAAL